VEIDAYIEVLRRDGAILAATAEARGLDSPVTTCPDWQLRDLLTHVGSVHRWANAHVAEGLANRAPLGGAGGVVAPGDDALVDWFRDGHATLVRTLGGADPALSCWTFLPATSPLMFWTRRQAHETAIHRVDSEAGFGPISRFDASFAADGIDELVMGFAPTPRAKVGAERRRVLSVETTDTDDAWAIGLGPDGIDSRRAKETGDGRLVGPAADLYLVLWNRLALDHSGIAVSGDLDLASLWATSLRV
jgi:uncharacterized protein (TIGR03083 family)